MNTWKALGNLLLLLLLLAACVARPAENEIDDDDDDDDSGSREQLPIASIKSRAIAMDRDLCRELSRYHPHYPRCQAYCRRLDHWVGMCRRDSCHCYS